MKLTEENKKIIDSKTYFGLLREWRFALIGDEWMEGETGKYWRKRMNEIKPDNHVQISKEIGWD